MEMENHNFKGGDYMEFFQLQRGEYMEMEKHSFKGVRPHSFQIQRGGGGVRGNGKSGRPRPYP